MLKALIKKQFMEINARFIGGRKNKKGGIKAGIAIYALAFGILGFTFFSTGAAMCMGFEGGEIDWIYFSIMGIIAIIVGIFGSVFTTYTTLYLAKDNDFLLSMPIPPKYIIATRLFVVWFWSLLYEGIVLLPAMLAYWLFVSCSLGAVIIGITAVFVLSFFVLTLTCLLGWAVAKISVHFKKNNIVITVLSLAFFALYYYVFMSASEYIQSIFENSSQIGNTIQSYAYPLYLMGKAAGGDLVSLLFITLMIAVLLLIVYAVISKSFLKTATTNRGTKKAKYSASPSKQKAPEKALLMKEVRRFTGSTTYMLNCGIGSLMVVLLGALAIINGNSLREISELPEITDEFVALFACAVLCLLPIMSTVTAPSVSLEGKNIWILKSLPVKTFDIFKAKIGLHLIITQLPMLFCSVCIAAALRLPMLYSVLIAVPPQAITVFTAVFGLAMNLKKPNLDWTNESVPVKQGISVVLTMLGGFALYALMVVLYFVAGGFLPAYAYLIFCTALISAVTALIVIWLKAKGTEIFESL